MKKNMKNIRIKFVIVSLLIIAICIPSFSATVSDNDGSAFITKSEFDSLKTNFQAQINHYNTSIDSKIDAAIASYLAGIKVESNTDIESTLWVANQSKPVKFTSTWDVPTTMIGNKYVITSMWWWIFEVAIKHSGSIYTELDVGMMQANQQNAQITESNYGDTDTIIALPGYNNIYNKYYIDNESFWNVLPKTSIFCFVWHDKLSRDWSANQSNMLNVYLNLSQVDTGTMAMRNSNFGSKQYKTNITIYGGIESPFTYSDVNIEYITQTNDTFKTLSSITGSKYVNTLAGNQVSGIIKATKLEDWNVTENSPIATYDTNTHLGWKTNSWTYGGAGADNVSKVYPNSWPTNMPLAEVYLKKNTDLEAVNLIHDTWSSVTDNLITYYSGIPLFKCTSDGIVELPLKFVVDGGTGGADFSIKDVAFNNTTNLETSTVEMYTDKELTTAYTNPSFSGETDFEKTIYFKVENGKTYWIKVKPNTSNDVIVNTKESKVTIFSDN